jgi:hypothetical protein
MTLTKLLTPIAIVAALSLAATPAQAQRRSGGGGGGSHASSRGSSPSRGGAPSRGTAVQRGSSAPRATVRVAPRVVSRGYYAGPRYYSRPYYSFRPRLSIGFGIWAGYPVGYPSYYDYPYAYGYPSYDPYAYSYPPSTYGYPAASQPYDYPPSAGYDPSGYPPSGYPADGSQGYPQQGAYPAQPAAGSVGVQVGGQQTNSGGVSFEITPSTAAVFVDGTYVGTVADFGPSSQPLGLAPGRHHVEVRAQGYQTLPFDADVVAGQVIPYRGTLQAQH